MTRLIFVGVLLTALSMDAPTVCAEGGCGLRPLKPLPPIGCADLIVHCQCDENADNCHWVWECVPIT